MPFTNQTCFATESVNELFTQPSQMTGLSLELLTMFCKIQSLQFTVRFTFNRFPIFKLVTNILFFSDVYFGNLAYHDGFLKETDICFYCTI